MPAGFREENAVWEPLAADASAWQASVYRYTAASAASLSSSPLIPLNDLTSQETWNARVGALAQFEYYEAGEAARLLRDAVGIRGAILIPELMNPGPTFNDALF